MNAVTSKIKNIFAAVTLLFIGFILIEDAPDMLGAVKKGIDICLTVIIPSLFSFMVLSSFMVNSGLHRIVFMPFYAVFKYIIRLTSDEFAILMLSILGGYPVGAKLLCDYISHNNNYNEIAPFRIPYMYCASPVFIISIVGISLYESVQIGLLVYLSNALSCLVFAALCNIKNKKKSPIFFIKSEIKLKQEVFINSVISSGKALFTVCLIVIVFTIIIEIISSLGLLNLFGKNGKTIFSSILEISNITSFSQNKKELLPLISAFTSFGGFCIISQVSAIIGGRFSLKHFYIQRIPIALLSSVICFLLTLNIDIPIKANFDIHPFSLSQIPSPAASVSLIIMVLLLILFLSARNGKKD